MGKKDWKSKAKALKKELKALRAGDETATAATPAHRLRRVSGAYR